MTTKSITKSILALFITATVFTSCSSNQKVTETKNKVQQTTTAVNKAASKLSGDNVKFLAGLQGVQQAKLLSVEVAYSATTNRELVVELKDSANKWIAGGKVNVTKGAGTKTVKIWSKTMVDKGDNYQIGVAIRPTGSTWKENIVRDVVKPFSVK